MMCPALTGSMCRLRGRCVAKTEQRTAGKPYAIVTETNTLDIKNDGQDTVVINVAIKDKRGVVVPTANNLVHFYVIHFSAREQIIRLGRKDSKTSAKNAFFVF